MKRVLVTAFAPYGEWQENASWLALQALTRNLPLSVDVTTRLYPVDFAEARVRLASDLQSPFDAVLHVGQAPGSAAIRLESVALNTRREPCETPDATRLLEPDGPVAYRSRLPLADWAELLKSEGLPVEVSLHAGDYLCNAALYWSHHFLAQQDRQAMAAFVHVPLDISQAAHQKSTAPSLPSEVSGYALRLLLEELSGDAPTALEAKAESQGTA